jgi:hypothetical protein
MKSAPEDLVVITWDGKGDHPACYRDDAPAQFVALLFDFTGRAEAPAGWEGTFLSRACEGKGDVFRCIYEHLLESGAVYRLVSLWDDDVEVATSQINALLDLGPRLNLDLFAPALSRDSYFAFKHTLRRSGSEWHPVPFTEVMMPFYPYPAFMAAGEFYRHSISAYGLDRFVMAAFQKLLGYRRSGVIDRVAVRHTRPLVSNQRVFRTGCNAWQEEAEVRRMAMQHVARVRPDLVGSWWYMNCFASLRGPGRFWGLWLRWPALAVRRMLGGAK